MRIHLNTRKTRDVEPFLDAIRLHGRARWMGPVSSWSHVDVSSATTIDQAVVCLRDYARFSREQKKLFSGTQETLPGGKKSVVAWS